MSVRRALCAATALLAIVRCTPVFGQSITTTQGLSLSDTLTQLTRPAGSRPVGEALALAMSLEVATAPFSTSSGGFVFKLDPSTGLQARTATTFGPSFAERALTSGEGKVSAGASVTSTTYDRLGGLSLDHLKLGSTTADNALASHVGLASLVLSSTTLVLSGAVGVTDRLDIGVSVPLISVKVDGVSWVQNGNTDVVLLARGSGTAAGLGDIAAFAKYRLLKFGEGTPDPGGVSLLATVHLPTGDPDNFRGLGITRTLVSAIASAGKGRFRPHVNAGYEHWSDGINVVTDFTANTTVTARHQFQYAVGSEFELAPKMTVLVDLIGRHIGGGGAIGFRTDTAAPNPFGVTSFESAVALPQGIDKITLVPGIKLNLKGSMLLSLNGLTTLHDNSLHARFTPVVGLDLTF